MIKNLKEKRIVLAIKVVLLKKKRIVGAGILLFLEVQYFFDPKNAATNLFQFRESLQPVIFWFSSW